jgi:cytochrome c553
MTFPRILGVAFGALLVTTALAQQQTAPATPPAAATAPAPASAEPTAAEAATVTPAAETAPAPVAALDDGRPAQPGDAAAGATKAAACAACHGADGNSADPMYPKLAGQHELYIARQLQLFKLGERVNPIMAPFASALTPQDMRDIGAHFAAQKMVPGLSDNTPIASGPNAGRKFFSVGEQLYRAGSPDGSVPACIACHGPTGRGIPGPTYPSIAGQHASYSANMLTQYRDGLVLGTGPRAMSMMSVVSRNLTDEEIQSLATYLASLHHVADEASAEEIAAAQAEAAAPAAPAADAAAPASDAATPAADDAAPASRPEAAAGTPQG